MYVMLPVYFFYVNHGNRNAETMPFPFISLRNFSFAQCSYAVNTAQVVIFPLRFGLEIHKFDTFKPFTDAYFFYSFSFIHNI